jgi:hypothetical protein
MMTYFTNEMSVRTLFVTNPERAITKFISAIVHETQDNDAATMVKFLYAPYNYAETVMDLYKAGKHTDAILQLVGNMLASVNPDVAFKGRCFMLYERESVFKALQNPDTADNAAYVILNYVHASRRNINTIPEAFQALLANLYTPDFVASYSHKTQTDLLWTAHEAETIECDVISVDFLLELISTTQHVNHLYVLLRLLAMKSEGELDDYAEIAYTRLVETVLLNDAYNYDAPILTEALFALSNIVVERGMAEHFLNDYTVVERVKELVSTYKGSALWVLMNAAMRAPACPRDVWALLEQEAASGAYSGMTADALHDTLAALESRAMRGRGTPAASTPPSPIPQDNAILLDIHELRQEVNDLNGWQACFLMCLERKKTFNFNAASNL